MNFLSLLSLFSKVDTALTVAQQISTLALNTSAALAESAGKTDTSKHLLVLSSAIQKDSALAESFLHVFSSLQSPVVQPSPSA